MSTTRDNNLQYILEERVRILALTLQPNSISGYRTAVRRFLRYLSSAFPAVLQPSDLLRDPHMLGWFTSLCDQQPPLSKKMRWSYLLLIRRLIHDLSHQGHAFAPGLIQPHDFPHLPQWLPRAISPEDDQRLQEYLRNNNDLLSLALLLLRLTGIRVGECIHLSADCLRQLGPDRWALHVPLGKLHSERLVPADDQIRDTVARIRTLRGGFSNPRFAYHQQFLLPHHGKGLGLYAALRSALADAARNANCSCRITPHQLRHTYATESIRFGVSLPAVMQLLGHKDIRMTLRYIQVTQLDLQREFFAARRNAESSYRMSRLSPPSLSGPSGICQTLNNALHLIESYRRDVTDRSIRNKLQQLLWRLTAIRTAFEKLSDS